MLYGMIVLTAVPLGCFLTKPRVAKHLRDVRYDGSNETVRKRVVSCFTVLLK